MKAKQVWEEGATVRVGFMGPFTVIKRIPTPGDYSPDKWLLVHDKTKDFWQFTPHLGIRRCVQ